LTHNISKIYTSNAYFITLTPHYSLTYRFSAMHRCFLDTLLLFCMKPWYKVTDSYALRNFYEEIRFDDFPCIYYRMYPFLSLFLGYQTWVVNFHRLGKYEPSNFTTHNVNVRWVIYFKLNAFSLIGHFELILYNQSKNWNMKLITITVMILGTYFIIVCSSKFTYQSLIWMERNYVAQN
jgi:hypothetical protein